MIPKRYYGPLASVIIGLVGVFLTGTMGDRYLAVEIFGVGLVIIAYFDDSLE